MLSIFSTQAFAELNVQTDGTSNAADSSAKKPYSTDLKACANKGNWLEFPENSVDSIINCNTQYISIDVKVSSDNVPVLMEDETLERMCVDTQGNAVEGAVSSKPFSQLETYRLRQSNGGVGTKITETKLASLSAALNAALDKVFILDLDFSDFDVVYSTVSSNNAQERVIYRIDGKTKDIIAAAKSKDPVAKIINKYNGNIIFSAMSLIKTSHASGFNLVELGTKNQYGVIFYETLTKNFKKYSQNAVFSMTGGYNAKRPDNIHGWDDVISHGYSIIETNYPKLLEAYIEDTKSLRLELDSLISKSADFVDGNYSKDTKSAFDKAYKNAVECQASVASKGDVANAYSALQAALSGLQTNGSISHLFNFSTGRIIAVVLCLAAVVAAQVFFYKKRQNKTH